MGAHDTDHPRGTEPHPLPPRCAIEAAGGVSGHTCYDPWLPREHARGHDPAHFDMRMTPFHTPHRLYGQGFRAMFPSRAPTRSGLWASRLWFPGRRQDLIIAHIVGSLTGHAKLEDVDPRWLRMSQSAVTSPGVRYYMDEPDYRRTGTTYADQYKVGNAFPLVYQRSEFGERVILAGHHRCAAALALGQPVRALLVRDDDDTILAAQQKPARGMLISELLQVASEPALTACTTAEQAATALRSNEAAVVLDAQIARQALLLSGAPPDWTRYATSGRGTRRT